MPTGKAKQSPWDAGRSPRRFQLLAKTLERILAARTYPEQGYRTCLGIIRLGQHYEPERVEAAAERALKFNTCSYKSMRAILAAGLDRPQDTEQPPQQTTLPMHPNIRGGGYYHD